jgi:hypothetical protein
MTRRKAITYEPITNRAQCMGCGATNSMNTVEITHLRRRRSIMSHSLYSGAENSGVCALEVGKWLAITQMRVQCDPLSEQ